MSKNKIGLIIGILLALFHAIWAIAIGIAPGLMQSLLDFIFKIHFIGNGWQLISFNFVDAILLVAVTFVSGYIIGFVGAWIWELFNKK